MAWPASPAIFWRALPTNLQVGQVVSLDREISATATTGQQLPPTAPTQRIFSINNKFIVVDIDLTHDGQIWVLLRTTRSVRHPVSYESVIRKSRQELEVQAQDPGGPRLKVGDEVQVPHEIVLFKSSWDQSLLELPPGTTFAISRLAPTARERAGCADGRSADTALYYLKPVNIYSINVPVTYETDWIRVYGLEYTVQGGPGIAPDIRLVVGDT